jgi:hypothetical protein
MSEATKRCWLYKGHNGAIESDIFTGNEAIEAAIADGWRDSPVLPDQPDNAGDTKPQAKAEEVAKKSPVNKPAAKPKAKPKAKAKPKPTLKAGVQTVKIGGADQATNDDHSPNTD